MNRLFLLIVFISISTCSFASRWEELDLYNQETIDLLDDLDSCLLRVDYAISLAENVGYDYGKAYALYLKGYIHRTQGDLGKAFLANLKGLSILQHEHDERAPETLVKLYLNTGEILEKHFNYEEAIQYYSEGLAIAKKENLTEWIIDLTYNAGYAHLLRGDMESALVYTHQSYKLARSEEDEYDIVNALNLMGMLLTDNHKYDTAELFFDKILQYEYVDLDANEFKGRAYHNLANTYAQSGDTTSAISAFKNALLYKKKRNKPEEIFITENDLAEIYYALGKYDKAYEMISNCIEHYDLMPLIPDNYKFFDLARKIKAALNEYSLSNHYANRYFEENEKFINQQEKLIKIRDQFKMEILTASFFVELERNKRIDTLNKAIVLILILSALIIGYLKIKQVWIKNLVGKELDKLGV